MSVQAAATSNYLDNAPSSRKRPLPPAAALASAPPKEPHHVPAPLSRPPKELHRASAPTSRPPKELRRSSTPISRPPQPKTIMAAAIRQRTQTHNRTPTPRPWNPVVKAEIHDGHLPAALPVSARCYGRYPVSVAPVAAPFVRVKTEPEDERPPVAARTVVASDEAAHVGEAAVQGSDAIGNINPEPAADVHAAADNDAGEDVPLDRGGVGAAEDEEGRLQFDGPWDFKYRGRRFLYVKESKHEGRLVECEACGGQFLVGIYKEHGKRKALANDDIDGHACFNENNAEEPLDREPKDPMTPAFDDLKFFMAADGSLAFKDAQSMYEYNELRSKKCKQQASHDGAGPSGASS